MCSLCRLPVAQNHNFGQILTFLGAPVPTPFYTDEGQIWCPIADPRYTFTCEISSRSVYSFVLWLRKKNNFCRFLDSAFSGVANWQQSDKAEHGCTTTNLPYSTVSKSFLYSNAFMAKSGAQSLTFKSVTNRQTDKQPNKKTLLRFWLPRRRVKSELHQT